VSSCFRLILAGEPTSKQGATVYPHTLTPNYDLRVWSLYASRLYIWMHAVARDSRKPLHPRPLFPKLLMAFVAIERMKVRTKFEVRGFTRSWDNRRYFKTLGSPWIRRSRSSKVTNFGTNRKRVCDFLLVRHSNLGPILHRCGDIARFLCSWVTPPIFHPNFRGVPVAPDRPCCISLKLLFSKNANLCDQGTWTSRTDGQTDRQTTYCGITALCVASRGKKFFWFVYGKIHQSLSFQDPCVKIGWEVWPAGQ